MVGIGALAFFAYSYLLTVTEDLTRATTSSLITVAIAGACIGFLPHNFFPARMFMGDSGAMLLGLLLATSTISLTGQIDTSELQDGPAGLVPAILPLVLPLAILALPFLDLTMAFIRRTYAGRWWFVADKQHLHHRLLQRGHSQRRAVMLMYVWSALVSFGVIVLALVRTGPAVDGVGRSGRLRAGAGLSPWAGRSARRPSAPSASDALTESPRDAQPICAVLVFPHAARAGNRVHATWPRTDHEKDCPPMTVDSRAEHAAPAERPEHPRRPRPKAAARRRCWRCDSQRALPGRVHPRLRRAGPGLGCAGGGHGAVLLRLGQYVMVLFADAGARTLLTVSLCSYTARVVVLAWSWCCTTGTTRPGRRSSRW